MEHLVDLDVLADRLLPVIEEWKRTAFVGSLTWRDEAPGWPKPIMADRSHVIVPESLGLRLRKHARDDEFEMVVWVGGWADVDYLLDGEIYAFCPEFRDVDGAHRAVINEVTGFLA